MSTSERAFNQVKAILGKLDRSIDEAREKRTRTPMPAPPPLPVRPEPATQAAIVPPAPAPGPNGSAYGRAQPLPRQNGSHQNGTHPNGATMQRWGT